MKVWSDFVFLVLCDRFFSVVATQPELTRLTAISHTQKLYADLRNDGVPSETDPATSNVESRKRICQFITKSAFFRMRHFDHVSEEKLSVEHQDPKYASVVHEIFELTESGDLVYTNNYRQKDFTVANTPTASPRSFAEYVFVCPIEDIAWEYVIPLYVSKEYNISSDGRTYKPGRFIFGNLPQRRWDNTYSLMLAEEPAAAYVQYEFNLELYYLRKRKYISPANSNKIDPLCKLISDKKHEPDDQHYRFCVVAFRSMYFVDRVKYPRMKSHPCELVKVFFQTAKGIKEAGEQSYFERMTRCHSTYVGRGRRESHFYISRAYESNRLFVYRRHPEDGKMYLENLSANVSIIDELNSFDYVENRR